MRTRNNPQMDARYTGVKNFADRPAANSPSLQLGDRVLVEDVMVLCVLVENALGQRGWVQIPLESDVVVAEGVTAIDGAGKVTVANAATAASDRIRYWYQGGAAPVGILYLAAITPGVSFEIDSTGGAADAGKLVYWQRCVHRDPAP